MKPIGKRREAGHNAAASRLLVAVTTCWVVTLIVLVCAVIGLGLTTQLPRLLPIGGPDSPDVFMIPMSTSNRIQNVFAGNWRR